MNELEAWKKEMNDPAFLSLGKAKEYWGLQRQKQHSR